MKKLLVNYDCRPRDAFRLMEEGTLYTVRATWATGLLAETEEREATRFTYAELRAAEAYYVWQFVNVPPSGRLAR